jgi:hypothetical protein
LGEPTASEMAFKIEAVGQIAEDIRIEVGMRMLRLLLMYLAALG